MLCFNDAAPTEISTLSLHDALPILRAARLRPLPPAVPRRGGAGACARRAGGAAAPDEPRHHRRDADGEGAAARRARAGQIGRAHVWTPIPPISRMAPSA